MNNISRFPIEPSSTYYQPTTYNINSGGYPKYRAYPIGTQIPEGSSYINEVDWYEGD